MEPELSSKPEKASHRRAMTQMEEIASKDYPHIHGRAGLPSGAPGCWSAEVRSRSLLLRPQAKNLNGFTPAEPPPCRAFDLIFTFAILCRSPAAQSAATPAVVVSGVYAPTLISVTRSASIPRGQPLTPTWLAPAFFRIE